jgi:aspartyl-tRNA(Asn)/glutamyl-tRNA(Gln) amidotransferase subunit A
MHGIPYGLKDIIDVADVRTTCCSKAMLDYVPREDSEVVRRLRAAGAILLGKMTTHEFAEGGPGEDLPFPAARNPWNCDFYTGGSSSGSAAGVAARMLRLALGTDSGGSIRLPSAHCGVVGLKPTLGRVSLRGIFPLAPSMDHCGLMTRSVEDAAIALQCIAGHDELDPGSADIPVPDYLGSLEAGIKGLRIAFPKDYILEACVTEPIVFKPLLRTLSLLREAGATVVEVRFPRFEVVQACGYTLLVAEGYATHAQNFRNRPLIYGQMLRRALAPGCSLTTDDYHVADTVRRKIRAHVEAILNDHDAIVTAGALSTAYMANGNTPSKPMSLNMIFNVVGLPAMAVPIGLAENGLPLSATIAGRAYDEVTVLRVGRAIEHLTGWELQPFP